MKIRTLIILSRKLLLLRNVISKAKHDFHKVNDINYMPVQLNRWIQLSAVYYLGHTKQVKLNVNHTGDSYTKKILQVIKSM